MPKQILSEPQPCLKCLKKYSLDLTNWTPCKNCPWATKQESKESNSLEKSQNQKICLECQETLNFIELEKDKYLCGKVKCLRNYIEKNSEKEE